MNDLAARDARLFRALFALMYDHFIAHSPEATLYRWAEPRANLARFDSLLDRTDAQRALAEGIEALEAEAAFVLVYEAYARYRAADYAFTAEDMHHLYAARHRLTMTPREAMDVIEARDVDAMSEHSGIERAFA